VGKDFFVARRFSERLVDWGGGPEISPNPYSQRKGTFAEAARYAVMRPQLNIHFFGKYSREGRCTQTA